VRWRNKGEQDFPSDATEMKESVHGADVLDLSIVISLRMEHTSCNELRSPSGFLFCLNLREELLECLRLLLALHICHDVYDLE